MNKWDARFLDMAKLVSGWSKDPSTKVGAVLTDGKEVISVGFNGLPKGVPDEVDQNMTDRARKYPMVIHAEVNAINYANRCLEGTTLYATHCLCAKCAGQAVQTGVKRVVVAALPDNRFVERWGEEMELAKYMLGHAGVSYEFFQGVGDG